jgi:hypothetical protein
VAAGWGRWSGVLMCVVMVGCGGCAAERRTVTIGHYLQPCDTTPEKEGWMSSWCFHDRDDDRWRPDILLQGLDLEWGLEQTIRVRIERHEDTRGAWWWWHFEELLESVAWPGGTTFEWAWDDGLLAFRALEQVDGAWYMRPRYNSFADAKGLDPADAEVEAQLEMLATNDRLKVNRMVLQYGDDSAVDPLIVLEVEIGDELGPAYEQVDRFGRSLL